MNNHHILYDEVVIFYFQLYAVLDNIPAPCVDVLLKTVQIDFSAGWCNNKDVIKLYL